MRKSMKRIVTVGLVTLLFLSGCGEVKEVNELKEVTKDLANEPQTMPIKLRDIEVNSTFSGVISPEVYQLTFPKNGVFDEYVVRLGDTVTKGQVLAYTQDDDSEKKLKLLNEAYDQNNEDFIFESTCLKKKIEMKEAELEKSYLYIKNETFGTDGYMMRCQAAGAIDRQLDRLKLDLQQLEEMHALDVPYYENQIKSLKDALGKNKIISPCDGVVVATQILDPGSYVDIGTYYIAIADPTTMYVMCDYIRPASAESLVSLYGVINGTKYELEYIPMDDLTYAQIKSKGQDPYSKLRIKNPGEDVKAGDDAIAVTVRFSVQNCVNVPNSAIEKDTGGKYVYVKNGSEKVKQYIKLGITDNAYTEVTEGLKEGDAVYVEN